MGHTRVSKNPPNDSSQETPDQIGSDQIGSEGQFLQNTGSGSGMQPQNHFYLFHSLRTSRAALSRFVIPPRCIIPYRVANKWRKFCVSVYIGSYNEERHGVVKAA